MQLQRDKNFIELCGNNRLCKLALRDRAARQETGDYDLLDKARSVMWI